MTVENEFGYIHGTHPSEQERLAKLGDLTDEPFLQFLQYDPNSWVLDVGSGMWLAIGVLAALVERNVTGKGKLIETSLYETGATWVSYHLSAEQLTGNPSKRSGSGHPAFSPYGIFATKEGALCIGVGSNNIFAKLCSLIGREDLVADPRFAANVDRVANAGILKQEIEKSLASHDAQYWDS